MQTIPRGHSIRTASELLPNRLRPRRLWSTYLAPAGNRSRDSRTCPTAQPWRNGGDIRGAQGAGMKSILVKTGKFRDENLENLKIVPDYIINSIADLSGLIQFN